MIRPFPQAGAASAAGSGRRHRWSLTFHWINILSCNCRLQPDGSWSGQVDYATWGTKVSSTCEELRYWLDAVPLPYPDANWVGQ